MPEPYEAISTQDKEQWTSQQNGKTFQSYVLTAKNQAGETVPIEINRALTSPPPSPGETIWLETWETEFGLKGRKKQAPRSTGQATFTPTDDDARQRSIVRQHSQHMALLWADLVAYGKAAGERMVDLNTLEAWTDHFDADVQRASGMTQDATANGDRKARFGAVPGSPGVSGAGESPAGKAGEGPGPPSPASSQTSNGEPKISDKQITNYILRRQKLYGVSDENMVLLVQSFGVERLKDLPRSKVDAFAEAMANPIPDGSSDVPAEPEPAASEADDALPF